MGWGRGVQIHLSDFSFFCVMFEIVLILPEETFQQHNVTDMIRVNFTDRKQ